VAREHHAGGPVEVGPRHHRVADPLDLQTAEPPERRLHGVDEVGFVARDGRGVHERAGEREDVGGEVEGPRGTHDTRA
jgi:hypothetical protein